MTPAEQTLSNFLLAKTGKPFNVAYIRADVLRAVARFADRGFAPILAGMPSAEQKIAAAEIINRATEELADAQAREYGQPRANTEGGRFVGEGQDDLFAECVARLVMNLGAVSDAEMAYHQVIALHRRGEYDAAIKRFGAIVDGTARIATGVQSAADTRKAYRDGVSAACEAVRKALDAIPVPA